MKNLVYVCVRGPEFRVMASMLVHSLRTVGKFTGDIQIICNTSDPVLESLASMATIRPLDMQCHIRDDRMMAMQYIDPTPYDQILNLDADIVALKDINPLFTATDELLYYNEPWGFISDLPRQQMYTYYFTDAEMRRYAWCHTINVGHWCVSRDRFHSLFEAWKSVLQSKPYDEAGADQAAFNTVIRRRMLPAQPFGPGLIANGIKTPEKEWRQYSIVHFAGRFADRMQKMQELTRAS